MNKHISCSSVLMFACVIFSTVYIYIQPSVDCYIQHSLYLYTTICGVLYSAQSISIYNHLWFVIFSTVYIYIQPSVYCQLLNVRVSGTSPDSQPLPMYGSGLHILNKALGESQKGMSISHVQNRQINHCTLHLRCTLHSLIDYHMYH